MLKGSGWGLFLLSIAGLSAFSFEARSQQQGLIGGGVVGAGQQQKLFTPTSIILGNDPFAEFEANFCEDKVKRESMQRLATSQINNPNPKHMATQAIGGVVGGLIAGGGSDSKLGEGFQAGLSGEACLEQDVLASTSPRLRCEDFKNGQGKVDENSFREIEEEISKQAGAASLAECQLNASVEAASLTDCYEDQQTKMLAAMQKVKRDFDLQIKAANDSAAKLDTEIKKEELKAKQLSKQAEALGNVANKVRALHAKLNSPSPGQPNGSEGTVAGMEKSIRQHREDIAAFGERVKIEKAKGIGSCMRDGGGVFSDIRNCPNASGDLITPKACILSAYSDSILVELSGGGNRFSNADRKKAEVKTKMFAQRLEQMMGEFSTGRIRDVNQFKANFASDLRQMGGGAAAAMENEIKTCAKQSEDDVGRRLDKGGDLNAEAAAFSQSATDISAGMGAALIEADSTMREAFQVAFGQDAGDKINGFKCHSSAVASNAPRNANGDPTGVGQLTFQTNSLDKQFGCIQEFNHTMFQMLNGTSPPGFEPKAGQASTPLQLSIKVTGPKGTPVDATDKDGNPVRCTSLDSCAQTASSLAEATTQLVGDMRGEGTFTSKLCPQGCQGLAGFKKTVNNQIREALEQSATDFGKRISGAAKSMARLKRILGKAGADVAGNVEKTDLEEVCPRAPAGSEEEICTLKGKDFDKLLAGLAGVETLEKDEFKSAKSALAERRKRANSDATAFNSNTSKLKQALNDCKKTKLTQGTGEKIAKFKGKMSSRLAKCKNGVPPNDPQRYDVGANFAGLETDFSAICEESTAEGCAEAGEQLANLRNECQQVVNTAISASKPPFVFQTNGPAPAAANVGGGGG